MPPIMNLMLKILNLCVVLIALPDHSFADKVDFEVARKIKLAAANLIPFDDTYLSTIRNTKQLIAYASSNRGSRPSRPTRSSRQNARGYIRSISGNFIMLFVALTFACIAVLILIKRSLKKKEGIKMKRLSGKMRLAVFLSFTWFIISLIVSGLIANENHFNDFEFFLLFLFMSVLPLLISWGIWWIKQGFKQDRKL
jgi:hypothetical protein